MRIPSRIVFINRCDSGLFSQIRKKIQSVLHLQDIMTVLQFYRIANGTIRQTRSFPKAHLACNLQLPASRAAFSVSSKAEAKNQVYASVRNLDQFHTYQLLSASARTPLLTLWTTSYCPTCRVVSPLLKELVESGVGEAEGGVAYCEVEYDAPDVMTAGLGLTYMINSIPTLLSFDAQEAQVETKVTDGKQLADRRFLEEWIRNEARRQGNRGGGGGSHRIGGVFSGLFGLFGKSK